jgi:hypothetical protein
LQNSADGILSTEQLARVEEVFPGESIGESKLSFIKISFLPHKKGYPHTLIRYECSKNLENLLECDIEQFFNMCNAKWNQLHAVQNEKKDLFPIMWRMFKPASHRKIMASVMQFYLSENPKLEMIEKVDIGSFTGKVSKCRVLFMIVPMPVPYERMPYAYIAVLEQSTLDNPVID